MSKCSSCGAAVIWTVTERGKRMPVDVEPADDGNVALHTEPNAVRSTVVGRTCPNASEHRRDR